MYKIRSESVTEQAIPIVGATLGVLQLSRAGQINTCAQRDLVSFYRATIGNRNRHRALSRYTQFTYAGQQFERNECEYRHPALQIAYPISDGLFTMPFD